MIGIALLLAATSAAAQDATPWEAKPEVVSKFSRRPGFNYDESKVPKYTLPNALETEAGAPVSDATAWPARRAELMELFRKHVYGRRPDTRYSVAFQLVKEIPDAFDGAATGRQMLTTIAIGERRFQFPFVLFIPNSARESNTPAPVVIHINNRYFVPLDKAVSDVDPFWPVKTMVERGYATASFHTSDVDPDVRDGYEKGESLDAPSPGKLQSLGVRAFFAEGKPPTDEAWRSLSAWGWAASRVLDHLETLPDVDAKRAAVSGHSRGGKTSLWAACEDRRFAIAYSNNSGCGGAALSRRAYGETVARITSSFPHWFCRNFAAYSDKEGDLPIDQHEVIGLIAPRAVYVASADEDLWADPRGEYLSLISAAPVFKLLQAKCIVDNQMPALNKPRVRGVTGYHIRTGGHGLGDPDWGWFLDFADQQWK